MNEDVTYKITVNLDHNEILYLDSLHKNRSEAVRIAIRNAKTQNNGVIRQILWNISIGCVSFSIFFIITNLLRWFFLGLAAFVLIYELYDIIHILKNRRHKKETPA